MSEEQQAQAQNQQQSQAQKAQATELTRALEDTLDSLTQSIERMEAIIRQLESGETDWEQSVQLLSEANELAVSSSQRLEQAVQETVYGAEPGAQLHDQQELELETDGPAGGPGQATGNQGAAQEEE